MMMSPTTETKTSPLAIVGASALFPGQPGSGGFWRNILASRDLITDVPPTHWLIEDYYDPDPAAPDKTYCKRGGFLNPVDFDSLEYGVTPNALPATDTSQLLALIVARQVLEDASRGQFDGLNRDRISVILGVASGTELLGSMVSRLQRPIWAKALRESGIPENEIDSICERIAANYVPWQESTFPGLLGNVVAGRIANRFNLGGTNSVVDAACASSLAALAMAANELHLGQSDLAIVGGVDTLNDILMYMCFSKTPAFSRTGDCRPFSSKADGTILGEGIAMLALRRLEDAERDGDAIYAVIAGLGTSSDGRSKSIYAPVAEGQAKSLRRAYEAAGYGPETVGLVEAHGTGTIAGDAAEFEGLRNVFDSSGRKDRQWCALGSVKSQIGHTKAAAGAAGLFKAVMALHHKVLPPTIKVEQPNPELKIETSPFYLNTRTRPWVRHPEYPRRASVSSFGFGGSNFHATLEEYTGPGSRAPRIRRTTSELVLLSNGNATEIVQACRDAASKTATAEQFTLLASSTQRQWNASKPFRLAVVASDESDLRSKLDKAASMIEKDPDKAFSDPSGIYFGVGPALGNIAFLFPGQGSQYLEMGAELATEFEQAREAWDVAASIVSEENTILSDIVFPRPGFTDEARTAAEQMLTATEWAQPAIGAASLAVLRIVQKLGLQPACVGGHSFGELTALFAAGAIDEASFLKTARKRGEVMAEAAKLPGTMTAISASVDVVRTRINASNSGVVIANINSPSQCVVSGQVAEIEQFEKEISATASFRRLNVATAFHSPMVAPATGQFLDYLTDVRLSAPHLPVYSNAEAAPYAGEPEAIRETLATQISSPVRFVEMIEAMNDSGVRIFLEIGPGSVLTGLVKQCLGARPHLAVSIDRKGMEGVTALWHALAQLSANGAALDFTGLMSQFQLPPEPRKAAKSPATVQLIGSNYGKPYPATDTGNKTTSRTMPVKQQSQPAPRPTPVSQTPAPTQIPPAPMPPHPTLQAPPTPAVQPSGDWLRVFQEFQMQTAEVHSAFQRSMTESHMAYLRSMEKFLSGMSGAAPTSASVPVYEPVPVFVPPAPSPALAPAPIRIETESVVAASVKETPPATEPPHLDAGSLKSRLLQIVSDKTGYPVEILDLEMELESGLGIDSIKRVEILSAMLEQTPGLPEVNGKDMARLRTLGEVLAHLDNALGQTGEPSVTTPVAEAPALSLEVLQKRLLEIVSEKTGYPVDILDVNMELESGLGIDSIKRVEILSAMMDRTPGLPEINGKEMARLRTLAEVIGYMAERISGVPEVQAAPVSAPAPVAPRVQRFELRQTNAPAGRMSPSELLRAKKVAIVGGPDELASELARELSRRKIDTAIAPEAPADADGVIFLGALKDFPDDDAAMRANHQAFVVAKTISRQMTDVGGVFITVQDTGGDFGLSGKHSRRTAYAAGVSGLVKTAAIEWPKASVKAIDIQREGREPAVLARILAEEIIQGGGELEVGLPSNGQRITLESVPVSLGLIAEDSWVDSQSILIASGGGRGVTAAALISLARSTRCRFVLLGRSPLLEEPEFCRKLSDAAALKRELANRARQDGRAPSPKELAQRASEILHAREVRQTLQSMQAAGSEALYFPVNVQDARAVGEALDEIRRRWGKPTGIIHAAGVLADKRITDKTIEQFNSVFQTKVQGLRALIEATADDPIQFVGLFSSVAARTGNIGQCDYAMANEILNKVASSEARRRGGACLVKSFNWGPWDGGMVTPALKEQFIKRGVPLIPLESGAQAFVDEIQRGTREAAEIVLGGDPRSAFGNPEIGSERSFEIKVDVDHFPELADHSIDGVPVVPVVQVLSWFLSAARYVNSSNTAAHCHDLKVLRGIRLPKFFDEGHVLKLKCRRATDTTISCEIRNETDGLHYSGTVELGGEPPSSGSLATVEGPTMEWPWSAKDVYEDSHLFHGPRFQSLKRLSAFSPAGASAVLEMPRGQRNAAVLDGGLQLLLLWVLGQKGRRSLPTRIGSFISYRMAEPIEHWDNLHCAIRITHDSSNHVGADLSFRTETGECVGEFRSVSVHLLDVDEATTAGES